ncbi:Gamma-glutamylcyclotransferase [Gracilariopsis chorda]|uniref:gamma-glutamylcyclotransferase n=1 Tax=Gracilariopsis chorda TaxID=448386 RepID=A0A2V3J010_9FLOR|nr:Gamma-glutamylcyclotransferase [Gracilariopsis chorda]|eukprot:PXF47734.1 Gamma-glutamylcyclotransferase [Gracilariopsis chorda]
MANESSWSEVLYFGYGANMSRAKMGTRGTIGYNRTSDTVAVEYSDVWNAYLQDWELCFHHRGCAPAEPAFASIRPRKGGEVYGVVYRICSEASWERLKKSECVSGRPEMSAYSLVEVDVECFFAHTPDRKTIRRVYTFISTAHKVVPEWQEETVLPSPRYMSWLITGAEQERLPQSYIERLKSMAVASVWKGSCMEEMGLMVQMLLYALIEVNTAFLLRPFTEMHWVVYVLHERVARKKAARGYERAVLVVCRTLMFWMYSGRAVVAVLLFMLNSEKWDSYQRLRNRKPAERASPQHEQEEPKTTKLERPGLK